MSSSLVLAEKILRSCAANMQREGKTDCLPDRQKSQHHHRIDRPTPICAHGKCTHVVVMRAHTPSGFRSRHFGSHRTCRRRRHVQSGNGPCPTRRCDTPASSRWACMGPVLPHWSNRSRTTFHRGGFEFSQRRMSPRNVPGGISSSVGSRLVACLSSSRVQTQSSRLTNQHVFS